MFTRNLNIEQQKALLSLAEFLFAHLSEEEKSYDEQGFSVIDMIFGRKDKPQKFTKLDVLKYQLFKEAREGDSVSIDITKFNTIFGTERAKLSLIGTLVWLNGYHQATQNDEHRISIGNHSFYCANLVAERNIRIYAQLLELNLETQYKPFYQWYVKQQEADAFVATLFPVPQPFEKIEVKS